MKGEQLIGRRNWEEKKWPSLFLNKKFHNRRELLDTNKSESVHLCWCRNIGQHVWRIEKASLERWVLLSWEGMSYMCWSQFLQMKDELLYWGIRVPLFYTNWEKSCLIVLKSLKYQRLSLSNLYKLTSKSVSIDYPSCNYLGTQF